MSDSVRPDHADMSLDAGLRTYMLGVYNKLALGMLVSAAAAYLTSSYPPVQDLMFQTAERWPASLSVLGALVSSASAALVLVCIFASRNLTQKTASLVYWSLVSLIGAPLGLVILSYTGVSVVLTFLIIATAFGGLSLVGYATKKALTGLGSLLIIGLLGLFLAAPFAVFSIQAFMINIVGVMVFAGLTAYDTPRLKMIYCESGGDKAAMGVATSLGALRAWGLRPVLVS